MLPEPWLSFLKKLDLIAGELTKIPCIGGFAVTQYYGSDRTTVDVDVIDVAPIASRNRLIEAGAKEARLRGSIASTSTLSGLPRSHTNMKAGSRQSTKVCSRIFILR
jgi:hypothetical protein